MSNQLDIIGEYLKNTGHFYITNVLQFSLDEKPYKLCSDVKEVDFWVALKKA
jgi:hypothetical protein